MGFSNPVTTAVHVISTSLYPITANTGWTAVDAFAYVDLTGRTQLAGWMQNQGTFTPAGGEVLGSLPPEIVPPPAGKPVPFALCAVSIGHTGVQLEVTTAGLLRVVPRPYGSAIAGGAVWSLDVLGWRR